MSNHVFMYWCRWIKDFKKVILNFPWMKNYSNSLGKSNPMWNRVLIEKMLTFVDFKSVKLDLKFVDLKCPILPEGCVLWREYGMGLNIFWSVHSTVSPAMSLLEKLSQMFCSDKRRPASELEILDSMENECGDYHPTAHRGRRRGTPMSSRGRAARERTVRTPLMARVSQIRAHRPASRQQRSQRGILEDWFNLW